MRQIMLLFHGVGNRGFALLEFRDGEAIRVAFAPMLVFGSFHRHKKRWIYRVDLNKGQQHRKVFQETFCRGLV